MCTVAATKDVIALMSFGLFKPRFGESNLSARMLLGKQKRRIRGQEFVVRGQDAVPSGPSKTSLASAERPGAASIAPRDHSQPETTNFEKVGPTYFLNLFRTVISFATLSRP